MRQYLLGPSFLGQSRITLSGKESQYLTRVLRIKQDQSFAGIDNQGRIWDLKMDSIGRDSCTLSCSQAEQGKAKVATDTMPSYAGPFPRIFLYQCLCKGKKIEQIVRQATEIGVEEIVLVQSTYCVSDFSNKSEKTVSLRTERLESQIKEAIQQSGSPIATHLNERVLKLTEVPGHWNKKGLGLFFHQSEIPDQKSLYGLLKDLPMEEPIAILIGSEGGFSDEECTFLETSEFKPVLLKTNILRAESAAIYAISAIQVLLTEK
ncbi:RsmE family RNA methyltransferase [uncultured Sphaerochaeta sp.]|uniref:RsmE family RNA methyltransferase n=1 Tax=uncultured Sphaerochaeta sp. TaxID=886478 RepID=UPI002A0A2072|nr:RsmE family RNA methyltransferase [uncultured Sphaerochaeta sp.]